MRRCWSCELGTRRGKQSRIRSRSSGPGTLSESSSIRRRAPEICIRTITCRPLLGVTTHLKGTIKKRLRPGCGGNLLEQRERHFLRGQKYMQNHKYSEAVIEFENVVHIDPKYPEGFLAL